MQIKYLKDAPLAQAGDVADVPDDQANILIILGLAQHHDDSNNDLLGLIDKNSNDDESTQTLTNNQELLKTDEASKTDEITDHADKQVQVSAEDAPTELSETAKPKKTKKKTDTESN